MSGKTNTESKRKYNKKAYKTHLYSYRHESELGESIGNFKAQKGSSFNYLVTKLLAEHFGVPMPTAEES